MPRHSEQVEIVIKAKEMASREVDRLQRQFRDMGGGDLSRAQNEIKKLTSNINMLQGESKEAAADMETMGGSATGLSGMFSSLKSNILGIGAAYAGWRIAKDVIGESIVAAADYEATLVSLNSVASSTGRDINKIYDEMQKHVGGLASKANIASGFLKGMTTELNVEQVSNMTAAIKDASIAMGEDFNVQLPMITKAIKQLNPAILDNIGVTVRLDQVNKRITDGFYGAGTAINEFTQQNAIYQEIMKQTAIFQGQEAKLLETAKGKWMALTTELVDFKLEVGDMLLTAVEPLLEFLTTPPRLNVSKELDAVNRSSVSLTGKLEFLNAEFKDGKMSIEEFAAAYTEAMKGMADAPDEDLSPLGLRDQAVYDELKEFIETQKDLLGQGEIIYDKFYKNILDATNEAAGQISSAFSGPVAADLWTLAREADAAATEIIRAYTEGILWLNQDKVGPVRAAMQSIAESYDEITEQMDVEDQEFWDAQMQRLEESLAFRKEMMYLNLSEEELLRLEAYDLEYQQQLEHDNQMIEQTRARAALELGISVEQVDQMVLEYKMAYNKIYSSVTQYTNRIGGDFRSFMHQMVSDTDQGVNSIGEIWNAIGKSIRSVILDMVVNSILDMISSIGAAIIKSAAEVAATKVTTAAYISLAAAKAAVTPWSAPSRIAASASVEAALQPLLVGFDDPINDALAFKHGADYADFFMSGAQSRFGAPGFGRDVVDYIGSPRGTPGASNTTIHLHFEGPTNDEFVRSVVAPAVEDAVRTGHSALMIEEDHLTGSTEMRI